MEKLLLLDGNSLINRAFYGLYGRQNLTAPDGTPTGALFAFFNMYLKLLEDVQPTHVAAAFDRREPTFRHQMFDAYKGTRKPMPDELAVQIPHLKDLLADFGVACVELAGYEADDLIGTLAEQHAGQMPVTVVSGDKDSFQLASSRVVILQPVTRGGKTETEIYDANAVRERYGIGPEQFIDLKALMGDPSDNIPGVRGIGEKTAAELLIRYGTLEHVYASLDELRPAVSAKLRAGREDAWLSRELATICKTAPINLTADQLRLGAYNKPNLTDKLTRLGFRTLLSRLSLDEAAGKQLTSRQAAVSEATAGGLAEDLAGHPGPVALLLQPGQPLCWLDRKDQVRCLRADDTGQARAILAESEQVFLVYDYKTYLRSQPDPLRPARVHDVLVAAYLLNQLDGRPDLERLYQRVTGAVMPRPDKPEEKQLDLFAMETDTGPDLNAAKTRALAAIGKNQRESIVARNLTLIADSVEFPLTALLADMETLGFAVDEKVLNHLSSQMAERLDTLQAEIYRLCGQSFNLNSPKQLSEVLFEQLGLKPGKKRSGGTWSTDAEELERLSGDHPAIPLILDYRQTAKLRATFVEGLLKAIDPADGRVHTTFNQTLTSTGRLSSSEPNLQNIPIRTAEGRQIRAAFVAAPGHLLIDADYSQIELRLLAHLSGDPEMVGAFVRREDIHTGTASRLFGVPAEQVTSDMRAIAKTMNFSIVYGISDFGLARDLGVSVREAHKLISDYETRYPKIRSYLDSLVTKAVQNGYVETMFGRRRYLPELKAANRSVRQFGERAAMNAPIQGTAADLIKIAMVLVDQALRQAGLKARLVLQVHDELIIEAPLDEAGQAADLLKSAMESAMTLSVPLVAEVSNGTSWAACKAGEEPRPEPDTEI